MNDDVKELLSFQMDINLARRGISPIQQGNEQFSTLKLCAQRGFYYLSPEFKKKETEAPREGLFQSKDENENKMIRKIDFDETNLNATPMGIKKAVHEDIINEVLDNPQTGYEPNLPVEAEAIEKTVHEDIINEVLDNPQTGYEPNLPVEAEAIEKAVHEDIINEVLDNPQTEYEPNLPVEAEAIEKTIPDNIKENHPNKEEEDLEDPTTTFQKDTRENDLNKEKEKSEDLTTTIPDDINENNPNEELEVFEDLATLSTDENNYEVFERAISQESQDGLADLKENEKRKTSRDQNRNRKDSNVIIFGGNNIFGDHARQERRQKMEDVSRRLKTFYTNKIQIKPEETTLFLKLKLVDHSDCPEQCVSSEKCKYLENQLTAMQHKISDILKDECNASFIRGVTGLGKNTIGEHLTSAWAKNKLFFGRFSLVFLVDCDELKSFHGEDIHNYFKSNFAVALEDLKNDDGEVLLILDGLDEFVGFEEALKSDTIISKLLTTNEDIFPRHSTIITGRPSVETVLRRHKDSITGRLRTLELHGLSDMRIKQLIKGYENEACRFEIFDDIDNSPIIRCLLNVPPFRNTLGVI